MCLLTSITQITSLGSKLSKTHTHLGNKSLRARLLTNFHSNPVSWTPYIRGAIDIRHNRKLLAFVCFKMWPLAALQSISRWVKRQNFEESSFVALPGAQYFKVFQQTSSQAYCHHTKLLLYSSSVGSYLKKGIPHICPFWYIATLFRPIKST